MSHALFANSVRALQKNLFDEHRGLSVKKRNKNRCVAFFLFVISKSWNYSEGPKMPFPYELPNQHAGPRRN